MRGQDEITLNAGTESSQLNKNASIFLKTQNLNMVMKRQVKKNKNVFIINKNIFIINKNRMKKQKYLGNTRVEL